MNDHNNIRTNKQEKNLTDVLNKISELQDMPLEVVKN
jgi:hypothetical protein